MHKRSRSTASLGGMARFHLARLRERLWLRPLVSCVLSIFAAILARAADALGPGAPLPDISSESIEKLLGLMSASMLVIAVFAVGAMLSAYASASSSATPRSFPLVVGDDVSQNALSTFIGAFIFGIVALVALLNDFYAQPGRFVLFVLTIFVFALVILGFVRWVDRIARLGRMGNTIDKVEAATDAALRLAARQPTFGAKRATSAFEGTPVCTRAVGYVQNIDMVRLQDVAEAWGARICIRALPGTFVSPGEPLAYVSGIDTAAHEDALQDAVAAFVVGDDRTFESDPRFGLTVLAEIACRALSPAVNDAGTAIDIIDTSVRLLVRWSQACEAREAPPVDFDRVAVPAISIDDFLHDAFNAIARDGAASVPVALRLQGAFRSLVLLGDDTITRAAAAHARLAADYAEAALTFPTELEAVRAAVEQNLRAAIDHGRGSEAAAV